MLYKKLKRKMVILLTASIVFANANVSVFASGNANAEIQIQNANEFLEENLSEKNTSMEEILAEYHKKVQNLESSSKLSKIVKTSEISEIQKETVKSLNAAGYEAYDVNPQTYQEIEECLFTDFSEIGLDEECSYIVVVGDGNLNNNERSSAGSSFQHTYNGTTYTLRYLTITAADDSVYSKASYVDLLETSDKTLINNLLNTAIYAYMEAIDSSVGTRLGLIASICGLSIEDFGTEASSTLGLNAATNWTKVYTQVWSNYDNAWAYGACVEMANMSSYMSGYYYSAAENRMVRVPEDEVETTKKSAKYSNSTWRKNYGVIGYLNSDTQYDVTGDAKYKYGNNTVITHHENY